MKSDRQPAPRPANCILGTLLRAGLFCLILSVAGQAQPTTGKFHASADSARVALMGYEGWIIDSIVVVGRNIYDTTQPGQSGVLFRTANKLHKITRLSVLRREVLFREGDPFVVDLAEETTRNLRLRFELYDATYRIRVLSEGHLAIEFRTIDQWSTFARFKITRDSDKTGYQAGIEERNLFGYNQLISLDYFVPGNEKAFFESRFRDQRFGGLPILVSLEYSGNPIRKARHLTVARPYYRLDQTWSFATSITDITGRRDIYIDTSLVAQSQRRGDLFSAFAEYRWGSYSRKLAFNLGYTYLFEQSFDNRILVPELFRPEFVASDSLYHFFGFGPAFQSVSFLRLKNINGLGYPEDFVLGRVHGLSYGRAFGSRLESYLYDRFQFSGSETHELGSNLATLSYQRTHWIKGGSDIQRLTSLTFRWYNYRLQFMTLATRGQYTKLSRQDGRSLLNLGGLEGLRGYDEFFRNGDHRLIFNIESRVFSGLEILSVLFGGVTFFDAGKIWTDSVDKSKGLWYHSLGIGLRISLEKSSRSQIIRIDLARAQNGDWQLLLGTGQYF